MAWRDRQREAQTATWYREIEARSLPYAAVIGPVPPRETCPIGIVDPGDPQHLPLEAPALDLDGCPCAIHTESVALPVQRSPAKVISLDADWLQFPAATPNAPAGGRNEAISCLIPPGPRITMRRQLQPAAASARVPMAFTANETAILTRNQYLATAFEATPRALSLDIAATSRQPELAASFTMVARSVALRPTCNVHVVEIAGFQSSLHRFRFEARSELRSLLTRPSTTTRKAQAPRTAPLPPPPPGVSKKELQERLHDLLMPPVEDLLADPQLCLPEQPFPFQMQGIGWLLQRENALLADEMGLGKTMQAIVGARLLWKLKKIARVLVVCPKSLIGNWRAEIMKWWPQIIGYAKTCDGDRQWFLRLATDNIVIKIINYEALAKEVDWIEEVAISHDLIIIDEAQRIKSPASATARAVKSLKSQYRWALTGTPLENRIEDVMSIFEFVKPGLLKRDDHAYVRERIRPYMLRRRADEVLQDLPQRLDLDVEIELTSKQRRAYERAEREGVVKLNAKGDSITITHVFQLITSLRQICNFDIESGQSAKLDRLQEDLEEILANRRKVLVFSQFTNDRGIERIASELEEEEPIAFHGKVPANRRDGLVHEFNTNPDRQIMLLNYAVGGVGLNLQAASYVYLFDRWWNPAVEDQAVKRAHRLGQKERVFVRRFVCKDTIEERILQKLRQKRALFDAIIDENRPEKAIGLSEEEIMGLFPGLTVRPKRKKESDHIPKLVMDNLDPQQFEILVSKVYEAQGYCVTLTGRSSDGGIDLLAEIPGRELVVVQCKRWRSPVGVPVVRELWGAVHGNHKYTRADLVTSSTVTRQAEQFASDKHPRLKLMDGEWLRSEARRFGIALFVGRDDEI